MASDLIRLYVARRLTVPILIMVVTMVATVTLNLTEAIAIGLGLSVALFVAEALRCGVGPADLARLAVVSGDEHAACERGRAADPAPPLGVRVATLRGPLHFGTLQRFVSGVGALRATPELVLSMRDVPVIDVSALLAFEHFWTVQAGRGRSFVLCGLQP